MSTNSLSIMIPCPELKPESIRRCLFGRPDPQKLSEELKRQDQVFHEEEVKRFRSRWSFDPATGPLKSGPYEFVAVDPLSEIPAFYTKGYPSVKSKHVVLSHVCYAERRSRPISAKRKLDLQDENIDGNRDNTGSIHNCAPLCRIGTCENVSSSPRREISEVDDSTCGSSTISRLRGSSLGLTRSSSEPTLLQLSPMTRLTEIMTPPSKPRVHHQSSITDYLPHKKQRVITKPVPKT